MRRHCLGLPIIALLTLPAASASAHAGVSRRSLHRARRVRRALVVVLLVLAALPAGAAAHAQLEGTSPTQGAALDAAPALVEFRFSEPVTFAADAVEVYDAAGRNVARGSALHPRGTGSTAGVRLPSRLPDGGYTAVYRVISADSHPVSGGFSFRVGSGGAAARSSASLLAGSGSGPVTATALGVARGVQYTAIAVALGALLALWSCWLPALRTVGGAGDAWRVASQRFADGVRRLGTTVAVAGVLASLAGLALEAAVGAGTAVWGIDGAAVGDVLESRFGVTWSLALVAWLVVLALVRLRFAALATLRTASLGAAGLAAPRARLVPLLIPCGALTLVPAFGGHAANAGPVAVMLPANLLHVVAVSAWAGGLVTLTALLRRAVRGLPADDRSALLAATLRRFSALALVSVAVVLATGVVQSLLNLSALSQLLDTAYGRAVLIKLGLFAILLGFGAYQRRRLLPRLRDGARLRRALGAEAAVMLLVFAVTGALSTYPPGDAVAATRPAGPVSQQRSIGPARGLLRVAPATVGPNALLVDFTDRRTGQPWRLPVAVRITASRPDAGLSLPVPVSTNGEGRWTAAGFVLPTAGEWRIAVAARVSDFDEYATTYTIDIP